MTNSDKMFKQAVFSGFNALRIQRDDEIGMIKPLPIKRVTLWARHTRLSCNRSLCRPSEATLIKR